MRRRRFLCVLSSAGLAGCFSAGTDERRESPTEPRETQPAEGPSGTAAATETPTATETRTPAPLTGTANGLFVTNRRASRVTARILITATETTESRRFDVELASGAERRYRELAVMDQPVRITVRTDEKTAEYEPETAGLVSIEFTSEGISFSEMVA